MQRVEHKVFPLVGPHVPGDDVGTAGDHHRVDIAADQHLAMAVDGRHRIVIAAIAHQGQRADPARLLVVSVAGETLLIAGSVAGLLPLDAQALHSAFLVGDNLSGKR
jgi:hypothetical protein